MVGRGEREAALCRPQKREMEASWIVQVAALVAGVCVAWAAQNWMSRRHSPARRRAEAARRLARAARLLASDGDAKEAAEEAQAAISLDPTHAAASGAHLLRALALERLGLLQSAVRSLDAALSPDVSQTMSPSQLSDALLRRASLLLFLSKKGVVRLDTAISDLRHSLRIQPDDPHALCLLAQCYERTNCFVDAEKAYQRAFALDPKSEEAWAGLKRLRP